MLYTKYYVNILIKSGDNTRKIRIIGEKCPLLTTIKTADTHGTSFADYAENSQSTRFLTKDADDLGLRQMSIVLQVKDHLQVHPMYRLAMESCEDNIGAELRQNRLQSSDIPVNCMPIE